MQLSTKEIPFGDSHNKLIKELGELIALSDCSSSNYYDSISDIISEYDRTLVNFPDSLLDLFFEFTDLLESVLLVSKRRHLSINSIEDVLIKLNHNYSIIYAAMVSGDRSSISTIFVELNRLREETRNQGLLPTVEECEEEMVETLAVMSDEEKEDLACLLRNP